MSEGCAEGFGGSGVWILDECGPMRKGVTSFACSLSGTGSCWELHFEFFDRHVYGNGG